MPLKTRPLLSVVCAGIVLAACSPPTMPRPPEPPVAPTPPVSPVPSGNSGTVVVGTIDDPQALQTFLRLQAIEERGSPPPAVAARTVDGGPAHPRITLVYLATGDWCGSGGCTLLVLEPGPDGLKPLSRSTISRPPIRVLKTRTNGMPDLSVQVRGDSYPGDGPKFVALPFDGRTYALNPTVPPARLLQGPVDGEIAISEDDVARARAR